MIRPLADDFGKTISIDLREPADTTFNLRLSERLLCNTCESAISAHETYMADVVFNQAYKSRHVASNIYCLEGLDYCKFKLFYLATLWRAHASQLEFFSKVDLGPKHSAAIARMVLTKDPGRENDYPLLLERLRDRTQRGLEHEIITQPVRSRHYNSTVYRVVFGGFNWNIIVKQNAPKGCLNYCLREDGSIHVMEFDSMQQDIIANSIKRYAQGMKTAR